MIGPEEMVTHDLGLHLRWGFRSFFFVGARALPGALPCLSPIEVPRINVL